MKGQLIRCVIAVGGLSLALSCRDGRDPLGPSAAERRLPLVPEAVAIAGDPPTAKNLLVIVVDTLRADRLGCYGYRGNTTPEMDAIAAQGIVFERFYAAASWTAPSFGTIFTGVSPAVHRVGRWLKPGHRDSVRIGNVSLFPLHPEVKTLAEHFGPAKEQLPILDRRSIPFGGVAPPRIGAASPSSSRLAERAPRQPNSGKLLFRGPFEKFDTSAFVTNVFLQRQLGFDRGFDHFDQVNGDLVGARRADKVVDRALAWLKKRQETPFMSVVHFFDPHTAYEPLEAYRSHFLPGPAPSDFVKAPFAPKGRLMRRGYDPSDAETAYIIGLYNAEVFHVDRHIGRLLREMGSLGILENTWVVITSDHGEEHFDHGGLNHGYQYEDEVTRVPLIIRPPGGAWGAGVRVQTVARHVDLVPTFLEWFSLPRPEYLEGESLMAILSGEEQRHRPAYMEYPLARNQHYAYFDGRYKLIVDKNEKQEYMYDLYKDPFERRKLSRGHPELERVASEMASYRRSRKALIRRLDRRRAEPEQGGPIRDTAPDRRLEPDVQAVLENLGYLSF